MYTIDQTNDILDEIADAMPFELYRELSGGILLMPEAKLHPKSIGNDLYILGEYCRSSIGTCIKIYYGSFARVYSHLPLDMYKEKLRAVLAHELRHHNETLAGYKDLILYDEDQIANYLKHKQKQEQQKQS